MTQKEMETKQKCRGEVRSNYQQGGVQNDHAVQSLAVNLMKTVRTGISDQTLIVEGIIEAIRPLLSNRSKCESLAKDTQSVQSRQMMLQLQAAVEGLQKVSNFLEERLFDLGQQLVKGHSSAMATQKANLARAYEQQIQRIKIEHLLERNKLQTKVQVYQMRCSELEQHLIIKSGQNPEELTLKRKTQLQTYLEAIQSLAEQLQSLKNPSRASLLHTEASSQHPLSYTNVPFHHAQYRHHESRDSQDLQAFLEAEQKSQNHWRQSQLCSVVQDYYPQNSGAKQQRVNRFDGNRAEIRSAYIRVSNSKDRSPAPQRILIYQGYPAQGQKLHIQESEEQIKRSSYSNKIGAGIARGSPINEEGYRGPGEKRRRDEETYTKVQQRNVRMQSVQEKLYGLKRKLEKQLRSMRS